jgi:hypothetical protein
VDSFSAIKNGVTNSKVASLQMISSNAIPAACLAVVLELGFIIFKS